MHQSDQTGLLIQPADGDTGSGKSGTDHRHRLFLQLPVPAHLPRGRKYKTVLYGPTRKSITLYAEREIQHERRHRPFRTLCSEEGYQRLLFPGRGLSDFHMVHERKQRTVGGRYGLPDGGTCQIQVHHSARRRSILRDCL